MPLVGNHYLGVGQIESLRPRVTFTLCHIWKVERTDGVKYLFASHDKTVKFRGENYKPIGPSASDLEQGEAGAESDFEMVGFLSAETIRAVDIYAKRFNGCKITHNVIDWERPWPNAWVRKHVWYIENIDEQGHLFRAQVQGVERFLTIPAGRTYERECDKILGSAECGATPRFLGSAIVEAVGTTGAPILGVFHNTASMRFTAATWTWSPSIRDGLLTQGRIVWTTGPNKRTSQHISEHVGREISLETRAPFAIKAGDVCDIWSGCNGSASACENDYNNKPRFGGQEFMPSTEDTYRKPQEV